MITIQSIKKDEKGMASWPGPDEICPICGEPFGTWKKVREPKNGKLVAVHKKCSVGSNLMTKRQDLAARAFGLCSVCCEQTYCPYKGAGQERCEGFVPSDYYHK